MGGRCLSSFLALLTLAFLFGCGSNNTYSPDVIAAALGVRVTISPTAATLPVGGTRTFSAAVTGTSNTVVTWSIQEGASGGSITSGGVYTAPNVPGTYHVVATSQADPTKHATATITVQAGNVQGTIN
jgi:hypothetical protein